MSTTPETQKLSVRRLAGVDRWGDLHPRQARHTTAEEGRKGHAALQKKRGEDYLAEQAISRTFQFEGVTLAVQGRIDGVLVDRDDGSVMLEEIKTTRTPVASIPPELIDQHRAQLRLYGAMWCAEQDLATVTLRLSYYDVDNGSETCLDEVASADDLALYMDVLLQKFLRRQELREYLATQRDLTLGDLRFPHSDYRAGQRDLAVATYRACQRGESLVLQAPTGLGKTVGVLFPAVQSLKGNAQGKVFYLSARTTTQELAEQALINMSDQGASLRFTLITARDKVCRNGDGPCDQMTCERTRGYYDRLAGAVEDALSYPALTRDAIAGIAARHELCPFELSLDLSELGDVIVCDYNYVFDPAVHLRRYFDEGGDHTLLVDEAHNLVSRARDMYSAAIARHKVGKVRKSLPAGLADVTRRLNGLYRSFSKLAKNPDPGATWQRLEEPPAVVCRATDRFNRAMEAALATGDAISDELLDLYFDTLRFSRTQERIDDGYVVSLEEGELELFCVDPSTQLAAVYAKIRAVICFSATLQPRRYFQQFLGLGESANWYALPSPFARDHLGVFAARYLRTTFRARDQSLPELVATLGAVVAQERGNYLVFFPSYRYLEAAFEAFIAAFPDIEVQRQHPFDNDHARAQFLARLRPGGATVAFAVTGSVFAEGIDLKGERLIGVLVVGVGMPQIDRRNELIRAFFAGEEGFNMAYVYPGLVRVLQTAGRVIRSENDTGIVCLLDQRYGEPRYRDALPDHWQVSDVLSESALEAGLSEFWAGLREKRGNPGTATEPLADAGQAAPGGPLELPGRPD